MNLRSPSVGILVWVLTVWETLTMGLAGFAKFGSADVWQRMFVGWGYPVWFTGVVGVLEMAGALLLLVPRAAPFAAVGLVAIMLGAILTLLTHESQMGPQTALVHTVLLTVIAILRWVRRAPAAVPADAN